MDDVVSALAWIADSVSGVCLVNGVQVLHGEEHGAIYYPENDPEGERRPFVVVSRECTFEEVGELTSRARQRYDSQRRFDGYAPLRWLTGGNVLDPIVGLFEQSGHAPT